MVFVPLKDLKEVFVPLKPPQAAIFLERCCFLLKNNSILLAESIFSKCFRDKNQHRIPKFSAYGGQKSLNPHTQVITVVMFPSRLSKQ